MAAPLSFFSRPPLGDARPAAIKRSTAVVLPPAKRAKVKPAIDTYRALTPTSDGPDDHVLHPAMDRIRAPPTPSTSTVAASSSPRRLASSPRRGYSKHKALSPTVPVYLDESTTLIFGRHRRAPVGLAAPPATLVPRLRNSTNLARTIGLDRSARHASRVHAAVELVSAQEGFTVRLIVLGQNGVRVRHGHSGRKRIRAGTVTEYSADEPLEVDFYGAAVEIHTQHEREPERERLFTPEAPVRQAPMSLPPSSPPMMPMEDDLSEPEEHPLTPAPDAVCAPTPGAVDLFSRDSSPLSEPEDEAPGLTTPAPPTFIPGLAPTPNLDIPRSSPAPASPVAVSSPTPAAPRQGTVPKSRAATPEIPPIPSTLDLPALLATTVVFSGSSKLSLPEIVKALLESTPSLKEHGDDKVWSVWCGTQLDSNPMFGKVARNGKDASGKPLLPHYFYNPSEDPDAARAKELGGLVRPLRAAQRTGGKVIDWRPVGSGRRRYHW